MQHTYACRRYHTATWPVSTTGIRLVASGLIACMAVTILASGVGAETIDSVDAGTGGNATATGIATLTAGDIYGGGNNGNSVILGDIVNSTVEIDGGTVTNPTVNILSMPAGTQIASADGGNDTRARLDEAGPPIDLDIDVRNRNESSNVNESTSNSTSNSNSNATGGAGGSSNSNSSSNNSNTSNNTNDNTSDNTSDNTNDNTGDNTNDNTGDNTNDNTGDNIIDNTVDITSADIDAILSQVLPPE